MSALKVKLRVAFWVALCILLIVCMAAVPAILRAVGTKPFKSIEVAKVIYCKGTSQQYTFSAEEAADIRTQLR